MLSTNFTLSLSTFSLSTTIEQNGAAYWKIMKTCIKFFTLISVSFFMSTPDMRIFYSCIRFDFFKTEIEFLYMKGSIISLLVESVNEK